VTISLSTYEREIEAEQGINYLFLLREVESLPSSSFYFASPPVPSSPPIFPTSQNVRAKFYYKISFTENDTFLAVKFPQACVKIQVVFEMKKPVFMGKLIKSVCHSFGEKKPVA